MVSWWPVSLVALGAAVLLAVGGSGPAPPRVERLPMELTETVTGGGRSVTVRTIREPGEAMDVFIARHNQAVAAVQASLGG